MQKQSGFTLVEMAIVMVIIGLLIGGIMKGQELLRATALNSYAAQLKEIETAVRFFKNKYGALPGDISNPDDVLPNCTADPCDEAGNANMRINGAGDVGIDDMSGVSATTDERVSAWSHLVAAGLMSGVKTGSTILLAGEAVPGSKIANAPMLIGYGGAALPLGTYVAAVAILDSGETCWACLMTGAEVAQIDRKMDNGTADSGIVVEMTGDAECSAGGAYIETSEISNCSFYFRLSVN